MYLCSLVHRYRRLCCYEASVATIAVRVRCGVLTGTIQGCCRQAHLIGLTQLPTNMSLWLLFDELHSRNIETAKYARNRGGEKNCRKWVDDSRRDSNARGATSPSLVFIYINLIRFFTTPLFQIIRCFVFFRYIIFYMYLDIMYI
jgi:hypothetical protein